MTSPSDPEDGFPTVPPPPEGVAAPPPAADAELGGQLHPAVIGVWSTTQVGAVVVLFLINPMSMLLALPFIGLVVLGSVVRWARFRWAVRDGALVIDQGLLNRQRRVIPMERIQSVDLVRRLTHRLFGVVGVQVEAIGGGDTEGQLDALAPEVAARLRRTLLAGRSAARGEAPPPDGDDRRDDGGGTAGGPRDPRGVLLASTTPRTLVVAGLTEVNATLIAGLFGLGWQLFGDRLDDVAERLPDLLRGNLVLVASLAALVVAVGLLVTAQLLAFWRFTLHRDGDELSIRRGLLEQRFDTIPLRRVQALRVEENLPRRLLGRAAVKADVAGKPGGGSGGTDTLLPLGTAAEARALVDRVLGLPGTATAALTPMPQRARRRRLVRAVLTVVLPTVPLALLWDPRLWLLLALLVPALAIAEASYRGLGHAELDDVVVVRAGWWVRRTAFVPADRLQALSVQQTVLQRWRGLATLGLGIARSPGLWQGPQMIDVDRDDAYAITLALAPVAARRRSRPATPATAAGAAVAGGGGRRIRTFEG